MNKPAILCVEDNQDTLYILKEQLLTRFNHQYQIETAKSGEEAIRIFNKIIKNDIDVPLIIADYMMPGMTGDELLKQIHTIAPKVVKVMLTGQADKQAVINAVNSANLYSERSDFRFS